MKKLEHIDVFDKSIYNDKGTTGLPECHVYTDPIHNVRNIYPSKNMIRLIDALGLVCDIKFNFDQEAITYTHSYNPPEIVERSVIEDDVNDENKKYK